MMQNDAMQTMMQNKEEIDIQSNSFTMMQNKEKSACSQIGTLSNDIRMIETKTSACSEMMLKRCKAKKKPACS